MVWGLVARAGIGILSKAFTRAAPAGGRSVSLGRTITTGAGLDLATGGNGANYLIDKAASGAFEASNWY